MASKTMKLREPAEPDQPVEIAAASQSKRPEAGRYLLQVDRQTKGSYATAEAAATAGLIIKKRFPVVQVSVYDRVGLENTSLNIASAEPTSGAGTA